MKMIDERNSIPAVFTCPKCGGHELVVEAAYNGVTERMKSARIASDGKVKLDLCPPDMGKAAVDSYGWHCASCGTEATQEHFKPAVEMSSLEVRAARLKKSARDTEERCDAECARKLCDAITDVFGDNDNKVARTMRMLREVLHSDDKFANEYEQALRRHGQDLFKYDIGTYYSTKGSKCLFTDCFDRLFAGHGWVMCLLCRKDGDSMLRLSGQTQQGEFRNNLVLAPGDTESCKDYVNALKAHYGTSKTYGIVDGIVEALRSSELENLMVNTCIAVDKMLKEMEDNQ